MIFYERPLIKIVTTILGIRKSRILKKKEGINLQKILSLQK